MKAQTSAYLDKALELLDQAEAIFRIGLNEPAGRTAYLAGFHAAQALLFDSTGKVFKSHKGVQKEFLRVTKDDPRVDRELRSFLGRGYNLKAIGQLLSMKSPYSQVSAENACEAIQTARRFLQCVQSLIPANGRTPRVPDAEPKA